MAKRRTEAEEEKRRQRRIMIFGILMIAIMLFSSFAYYLSTGSSSSSSNKLEYGDYTFEYRDLGNGAGVLVTKINGQEVEFQNLPAQVTFLQVDPQAIALLQNANQVALSADPNLSRQDAGLVDYARLQIGLAIPKAFNSMAREDKRYALPVFTCAEATPQVPVLMFNLSNASTITTQGNCIIVNGNDRALMQLKDRLIFEYAGILKNGEVVDD